MATKSLRYWMSGLNDFCLLLSPLEVTPSMAVLEVLECVKGDDDEDSLARHRVF
jgi:hypothetical protein